MVDAIEVDQSPSVGFRSDVGEVAYDAEEREGIGGSQVQ
jgi:hypothetical protein